MAGLGISRVKNTAYQYLVHFEGNVSRRVGRSDEAEKRLGGGDRWAGWQGGRMLLRGDGGKV